MKTLTLHRRSTAPVENPPLVCSGSMAVAHDGTDVDEYRGHLGRIFVFCGPCADAAGRLGMIDRRAAVRLID